MKIMPVQKQTRAGQRTRFKAFVAVGDFDGHLGLGVKCAKEVATAIRGAIILAKLSTVPIRRGYWGNKLGEPHTVPSKVQGKTASVFVKLIPAPRGTGLVAAPASKRMLQLAGVGDCYTQSRGATSSACSDSLPLPTLTDISLLQPWATSSRPPSSPSPRPTASSPLTSGPSSLLLKLLTTSSLATSRWPRRRSTPRHLSRVA